MFNFGMNIVVAASSLTKNKTGPRIGSVGFVSGNYKLPSPKYIDKEFPALLIPQRVIFTNFGFETKLRVEEKVIIGILPIPAFNKSFNEETTRLFTEIHGNLQHKRWQKIIMNIYNWKCKPICLVVPNIVPKQPIDKNNAIFIAWTKAVLKSGYVCNILSDMLSKNPNIFKKKFGLNISIIETLLRMSANTEKFNDKIDILLKRYKEETIHIISWLNTIIVQHNVAIQMKRFEDILIPRRGNRFNRKRGIETIGKIIFSPLFYKLCLYAKTTKRKEIIEFMDNMAVVRAKSVNLLL